MIRVSFMAYFLWSESYSRGIYKNNFGASYLFVAILCKRQT